MIRRLALTLIAFFALTGIAQAEIDGNWLIQGWTVFSDTELEEPDGLIFFGYVTGVLNGSIMNSTIFDHVPSDVPLEKLVYIIGVYIDRHKGEDGFGTQNAVTIITKAVLAKFPCPVKSGINM